MHIHVYWWSGFQTVTVRKESHWPACHCWTVTTKEWTKTPLHPPITMQPLAPKILPIISLTWTQYPHFSWADQWPRAAQVGCHLGQHMLPLVCNWFIDQPCFPLLYQPAYSPFLNTFEEGVFFQLGAGRHMNAIHMSAYSFYKQWRKHVVIYLLKYIRVGFVMPGDTFPTAWPGSCWWGPVARQKCEGQF